MIFLKNIFMPYFFKMISVLITYLASILLNSLICNLLVLKVFLNKRLKRFTTRYIYIVQMTVDTTFLIYSIILIFLDQLSNIKLENFSQFSCKINRFISFAYFPISIWLLVAISIEKFISIKYPRLKFIKSSYFQFSVIFASFVYNMTLYSPIFYFATLEFINESSVNETKSAYKCNLGIASHITDLVNTVVLPFVLMLIFSALLIHTILKSRLRILRMSNQQDRNRLRKDVQFAISSIALNVSFFVFNFPSSYCQMFLTEDSDMKKISDYIFYFSLSINFYILLAFNSLVRNETIRIFCKKNQ